MSITAELFWHAPEWAHLVVWALTRRLATRVTTQGRYIGCRWQYRRYIRKPQGGR